MTEEPTVTTKVAVISEIVKQIGAQSEEIQAINTEFNAIIKESPGTSIYDLIKLCGEKYDHEAFLIGAMVSATVIELVNNANEQKIAEVGRQTYAGVEFA